MANKPLRPCKRPGCFALTREGYCPEHKPKQAQRRESAEWHAWYFLPIWTDDLRPTQLFREPFCRECARKGIRTRATDVDHVVDHKGVWERFIDRANLQSLCHSCHSRKTMRERWQKARKK